MRSGVTRFFNAAGGGGCRVTTTVAANRNYELKHSQRIEFQFLRLDNLKLSSA
jgi:hypothetical protein